MVCLLLFRLDFVIRAISVSSFLICAGFFLYDPDGAFTSGTSSSETIFLTGIEIPWVFFGRLYFLWPSFFLTGIEILLVQYGDLIVKRIRYGNDYLDISSSQKTILGRKATRRCRNG